MRIRLRSIGRQRSLSGSSVSVWPIAATRCWRRAEDGLEDEIVSHTQGIELYRALKLVDVPTRLVLYPREGHEYVEPAHQIDVIRRTLEWLERYLNK